MLKKLFSRWSKKSAGGGCDNGLQRVVLQGNSLLSMAIGYGGGYYGNRMSDAESMRLYRQSSAVATAVDLIAQEIEHVTPVVDQKGLLDDSHEILSLLKRPNDRNETYSDLIGQFARNWLLTHNAYGFAVGAVNRPPVELYAIKSQNVSVTEDANSGFPSSFGIYSNVGRGLYRAKGTPKMGTRYYDGALKELWQIKGYSSWSSDSYGDSPLLPIFLEIYQQIKGRIHNVNLLENGATPSLIVTFKDSEVVDQDSFDARAQSIKEQLAGAGNAGKVVVADGESFDVKTVSQSNKDMDFSNLDSSSRLAIYNRYNIPLPLVSNDASTFSNMANAVEHFYDFAVLPNLDKIFASLSMWLMPRYGLDPSEVKLTYNPESIIPLQRRRLEELKTRKELNLETTNELREALPNREPIEGGDTLYQGANLVPVGEDLFTDDNFTTVDEQAQVLIDRDEGE